MKWTLFAILAFLLYSNINNFIRISKKKPPFEKLDQCLSPIKKMIKRNVNISFKSNSSSLENYYLTQFILAPTLLDYNGISDTIVYLKDLKIKSLNDSVYFKENKVVLSVKNESFQAFMLIKK
jgi:hypothetical protein